MKSMMLLWEKKKIQVGGCKSASSQRSVIDYFPVSLLDFSALKSQCDWRTQEHDLQPITELGIYGF